MHPILFDLPWFTVYTYGVLLAAAYLLGLQFAVSRARRRGLPPQRVMDLGIWILISALVGAKLFLLIQYWPQYSRSAADIANLLRSAGVFYGGLIGAVAVAALYVWRYRMPLWPTADAFAPGIALGHVVGRLGCFMAGCCYGKETTLPWGITFHSPFAHANSGTPLNVPLHPTQLYEAGAELLILAWLLVSERRSSRAAGIFAGRTFWTYLLLYAVSRFVIEFFRGDDRGLVLGVFSASQFVSVLLAPVAVVMLIVLSRRGERDPINRAGSLRVA